MSKKLLLSIAISLATSSPAVLLAENTIPSSPTSTVQTTKVTEQQTWLGIGLAVVPDIIRSQLSAVIPTGQGVMITHVVPTSPAQQAGLQRYDVLIRYNDQQLYSPQQLAGLVKAAPADSNITLQLIRQGQQQTVRVNLGKHNIPQYKQHRLQPMFQQWPMQPVMPFLTPNANSNSSTLAWDSFENVQIKTLADGRYYAEVSYKTPQGEEKSFTFEGKREEIIQQIKQQKDLPENKKQALLNALNMKPNDMFSQPFFSQGFPFMNMPHLQQMFSSPSVTEQQGKVL